MRPVLRVSFAVAAICGACLPGKLWGQSFVTCGSGICASPTGTNVFITGYVQTPHINGAAGLLFDTGDDAYDITFGASYMIVKSSGNVGIGTTSPAHLLHVAGTIGAEEIIVSSTGADYVFQPDYHLLPLQEVATFIRENHHLPGIPSAAEVKEKGFSVGEMEAKLLAKVEELTLHLIQAEERSVKAEARSDKLEQQNRELQEKFARFEKVLGDGSVKANRESSGKPRQ